MMDDCIIKPTALKFEKKTMIDSLEKGSYPSASPIQNPTAIRSSIPSFPQRLGAMGLEYHAAAHHQQFIGLVSG